VLPLVLLVLLLVRLLVLLVVRLVVRLVVLLVLLVLLLAATRAASSLASSHRPCLLHTGLLGPMKVHHQRLLLPHHLLLLLLLLLQRRWRRPRTLQRCIPAARRHAGPQGQARRGPGRCRRRHAAVRACRLARGRAGKARERVGRRQHVVVFIVIGDDWVGVVIAVGGTAARLAAVHGRRTLRRCCRARVAVPVGAPGRIRSICGCTRGTARGRQRELCPLADGGGRLGNGGVLGGPMACCRPGRWLRRSRIRTRHVRWAVGGWLLLLLLLLLG
jgi:hypothetical protein